MFTYSREQSIGTDARCLKLIALLRSEYLYKIAGFFQRKTKNEKNISLAKKEIYTRNIRSILVPAGIRICVAKKCAHNPPRCHGYLTQKPEKQVCTPLKCSAGLTPADNCSSGWAMTRCRSTALYLPLAVESGTELSPQVPYVGTNQA